MIQQPTYKVIFRQDDAMARTILILRVSEYLDEQQLNDKYVNLYANEHEVVVVVNDRDTAIKLKLALA
ncbi:hypothetical protein AX777_05970 [Sphingobium yanoikuyae]|uniref:Uncharacterized protein n=2 Tax=Sphingobium yanoikuyae TaxID=13690 RepID=A0A177JPQ5_SPHYA|nr:hypothetical protein AX777_05970 [Sphingobium yanoikuyae]